MSIKPEKNDSKPINSPIESDIEKMSRVTLSTIKKIVVLVIGSTLLLLGAVMVITPGPGIPVLIVGLVVLATEFVWAKVWLKKVRSGLKEGETKARKFLHMEEKNKENERK